MKKFLQAKVIIGIYFPYSAIEDICLSLIKQIQGLERQIEKHKRKIEKEKGRRDITHEYWRREIADFKQQKEDKMELLSKLKKKKKYV